MSGEKLRKFLEELADLEEKHGVYIAADYEEFIDYDWEESPYVASVSAHLIYTDKEGNKISENEIEY
ncbi:hypothetical protein NSS71_08160 [Niallia sp. FSL W8-0951]|uniref:hypothetical protein n=1 Tax=Niallia sp. FSL W8-0951 TaxID=2954639 RepID=UPI0030F86150